LAQRDQVLMASAFLSGCVNVKWPQAAGGLIVVASMFVAELGPRDCCDAMPPRVECC